MTNNNQDHQIIMQKLQAPFPLSDVEFRIGSTNADKTRGMALAYLTSRAIQARLDEVFGIGGWQSKFETWKDKGVLCTISVKIDGEWVNKQDGAEETDIEAVKGSFSSALKRCAVNLGIGRYLYALEPQWVQIKKAGNSFVLAQTPTLPSWALPSVEKQSAPAPAPQSTYQPISQQSPVSDVVNIEDKKPATQQHGDPCECSYCHKINVPATVKKFSEKRWGNPVCYNCQQDHPLQQVSGNPAPSSIQSLVNHQSQAQEFHRHHEEFDSPFGGDDEIPF